MEMTTETLLDTCRSIRELERPWNHSEAARLFRALRNSCTEGPDIQTFISQKAEVLDRTKSVITDAVQLVDPSEDVLLAATIGIQLLGNLIVNNRETAYVVWNLMKDGMILACLRSGNSKIRNYSSMVLLNVLLQCDDAPGELLSSSVSAEVIDKLVEAASSGAEFSLYVIQECILKQQELCIVYEKLQKQTKIFLLETVHQTLTTNHITDSVDTTVSPDVVKYLKDIFKGKCDVLLQTFRDQSTLEPLEYSRILEILGFCSGSAAYRSLLQDDKSLLISSVYLLICFHQCARSNEAGFSRIEDLSALAPGKKDKLQEDPTFCFKRDLIRLIANLAWKNKANQDEIRNMEAIPTILECCCTDARNPFMAQWCIVAVRNLCENNLENQRIIASMTEEGVVDSEVLQQMGFHIEEKRIRLS